MDVESVPKKVWQDAEKRALTLRQLAALDEAPVHLVQAAARDLNISERWAYRLIRRLRERDGELTALLPQQGRGGPRRPRISGDRKAIISEVIETRYLTRQKVRRTEIVKAIKVKCREAGISPPSEATIRRRIANVGKDAISRQREADPDTRPVYGEAPIPAYPLDFVQIDPTPVDLMLVDPFERLPIGRPWLTVAIDVMSRAIAGFHLSLDAPSATSVGLCLTHIATDKKLWMAARAVTGVDWPIAGKPKKLGVDNVLCSERLADLGVRSCSRWSIPARHQSAAGRALGQRAVSPITNTEYAHGGSHRPQDEILSQPSGRPEHYLRDHRRSGRCLHGLMREGSFRRASSPRRRDDRVGRL